MDRGEYQNKDGTPLTGKRLCMKLDLLMNSFEVFKAKHNQGCLTRRTWRFGRRFRTRTDGHTCSSILFRRTSACKNFFTIFFFTMGNFSEADVSNLNPRWRRARADARGRAQTGEDARRRVRAGTDE